MKTIILGITWIISIWSFWYFANYPIRPIRPIYINDPREPYCSLGIDTLEAKKFCE